MAGGRRISLRRTEQYSSKVDQELRSIREEKTFTDVKILTNGCEIPCHRLRLAIHSPVLKVMMTTNMEEAANAEVRLDHISKDIMDILLDYMYCGDEDFHSDQLLDVIAACTCNYLQMTELMDVCAVEVPDSLEPANVLTWWIETDAMDLHSIKSKCEEMMRQQFKEVSKQPDFVSLSHTKLQCYLRDVCDDSVASDDVLDAIMRWTEHEVDDRVMHLESLMQLVKLNKCTVQGITSVIKAHDTMLDQRYRVYKLLNNTLIDLAESGKSVLLLVGGRVKTDVSPVVWTLNQSNEMEELCKIPFERFRCGHSVCKVPPGFMITGCDCFKLCIMFVAATRTWVRMPDMLSNRIVHGSICMGRVLFILSGYDTAKKEETPSVHFMAIQNGQWKPGPDLPIKASFPNVSDVDGSIYFLDSKTTKQLLRLDMTQKVWSKLASLPVDGECGGASMTSARGRLYVAGGKDGFCASYNPTTDSWSTGQQPLQKHWYGSLVYHKDKLVLLGGSGREDTEEYNIDENTWSVCSYKMPAGLNHHGAVVLDMPPL